MTSRRGFIVSAAGALALPGVALAAKPKNPVMIPGNPPRLDFGGGLVIPMDRTIFKTLWEGEDRWIAYGRGLGNRELAAMSKAEDAAVGTMKLLLLTLAFKPERLEKVEGCGWRSKSGKAEDLVQGDVKLPGRPVMPTTDKVSNDGEGGEALIQAITGYMVMKADITLDDVKATARLVQPG